jgi:probable rRNA maturation factor
MAGNINFFNADVSYRLKNKRAVRNWISLCIQKSGRDFSEINFIFCSDKYLLKMNRDYLQHDYFTDIITFSSGTAKCIGGEAYISIDRVKQNAVEFNVPLELETRRVMIHGILHLLGYKDKHKNDITEMRKMENKMLSLF